MNTLKFLSLVVLSSILLFSCKPEKQVTIEKKNPAKVEAKIASTASQKKQMKNLDVAYCMGKFDPAQHNDFIAIPLKYADREGMFMRKDAYESFEKMFSAAYADGIKLQIRSASRNFDYQRGIWERKWTGKTKLSDGTDVSKDIAKPKDKALKILEFSSMPGTSRHHWGTDIDLNAFNNEYFATGEGKKLYEWMVANASSYGYCQPYTPKGTDRPDGYNEEKWHWSYQPISREITNFAEANLTNQMIKGFMGAETTEEIDVVRKYVLGINQSCRH